jgi:hypothetical protein
MQVGRTGAWKLFILQAEHGTCFSGLSLGLGWFLSLLKIGRLYLFCDSRFTGYTQNNGAVLKDIKRFISHPTRAQHTLSAAETVQVSHALFHLALDITRHTSTW